MTPPPLHRGAPSDRLLPKRAQEVFTSKRAEKTGGIASALPHGLPRRRKNPELAGTPAASRSRRINWSPTCKTDGVILPGTNLLARGGQRLKAHVLAWASEKTTPARTALGFAAGIFIGIFPSFAVGSLIAFYLAGRLGLHQGAALSGTFLMNPLTAPMVYSLSYAVGAGLSGAPPSATGGDLIAGLQHLGWTFLLGNTIVAILAATLLGLAVFFWMRRAESRKAAAESALPLPASVFPA